MRLDYRATVIQRYYRGHRVRRPLRELRRLVKGRMARRKLLQLVKEATMRQNLQHQANEAMRKASEAEKKALAGSLRYMVMQRLRDRAEKAKQLAQQQLIVAQKEIEDLRSVIVKKDEEMGKLQKFLQDAQTQAEKSVKEAENYVGEPLYTPRKARTSAKHSPTPSPAFSPSFSSSPTPSYAQDIAPPITLPGNFQSLSSPTPSPRKQNPLSQSSPSLEFPQSQTNSKPWTNQKDLRRLSSIQIRTNNGSSHDTYSNDNSKEYMAPTSLSPSEMDTPKHLSRQLGKKEGLVDTRFDKLLVGMQKEVELSQKLKQENQMLREAKKEVEERMEEIERELEDTRRLKSEAEEVLISKDTEVTDLEGRIMTLQERLKEKERLEQEVKSLRAKFLSLNAATRPQLPQNMVLEVFLKEIGGGKNLGFSESGHPVAAVMVYKALIYWKTFEAERTNTFDQIVETFQSAYRDGNTAVQAYWLSNTVVLYQLAKGYRQKSRPVQQSFPFFNRQDSADAEEHMSAMVFKLQLGISMNNLYLSIRDSIKAELLQLLSGPPPTGPTLGRATSMSVGRKASGQYWAGLLGVLKTLLHTLRFNFVPPLLVHSLLRQLLAFIDVKIFNSLVVRSQWCPCTYGNGEVMGRGLEKMVAWLHEVQPWLDACLGAETELLTDELCHLGDTVAFLLCEHKAEKTVENFRELCPNLTMNQLVHLCLWYEDDKYDTSGVDKAVIEAMWAQMLEDSQMLLKDDSDVTFDLEHLLSTLPEVNVDEVEPPAELQQDDSFFFLLPNMDDLSETPSRSLSVRSSSIWPEFFGQHQQPTLSPGSSLSSSSSLPKAPTSHTRWNR